MLAPRAVKRKAAAKASPASTASATPALDDGSEHATASVTDETGTDSRELSREVSSGLEVPGHAGASEASEPLQPQEQPAPEAKLVASTSTQEQTLAVLPQDHKKQREHLDLLRYTIEESMSDWGLSYQHPDLLTKLEASETGYVHIFNLLSLPAIEGMTTSLSDITAALRSEASDSVELDETGFQIKRKTAPDWEALAKISDEDWAERTFYLENVPKPSKGKSYSLPSLRTFLSSLFESPVDAVRLPSLYTNPGKDAELKPVHLSMASRNETMYGNTSGSPPGTRSSTKSVREQYSMPNNGGPFKGFTFVVIRDGEKALQAQQRWTWDSKGKRSYSHHEEVEIEEYDEVQRQVYEEQEQAAVIENQETSDSPPSKEEQDAEADDSHLSETNGNAEASTSVSVVPPVKAAKERTPQEQADRAGLCLMPIEQFNALRQEYLRYSRDITTLREKQEAVKDTFSSRQQRRSVSPPWSRSKKREPSPDRWERKPRSPSPDRWIRKPLSPERDKRPARRYDDAQDGDYPRGCVCFIKRLHPDARSGTLKALFQAILEMEEVSPKDHLQHVDHKRNVDSCHVRFSEAATAHFFASYFSGNPKYCHVDPRSTDPSEAFAAVKKGESVRPIEAEVVSGIPEAIYWSTVPDGIKRGYEPSTRKKTEIEEVEEAPEKSISEAVVLNGASADEANTPSESTTKRSLEEVDSADSKEAKVLKQEHVTQE